MKIRIKTELVFDNIFLEITNKEFKKLKKHSTFHIRSEEDFYVVSKEDFTKIIINRRKSKLKKLNN